MVDPRMAQATAVHMKIATIAIIRFNMVGVSRLSPPHPQPTALGWRYQVLFAAKYKRAQRSPLLHVAADFSPPCLSRPNRRETRAAKTSHPRLQERLIDEGLAQRLHIGPPGAKHTLSHANKNQVVSRIDPEPCVRRSEPEESAFANHFVGLQRVREDRAIIPPPQAGSGPHKKTLARHEAGSKMV